MSIGFAIFVFLLGVVTLMFIKVTVNNRDDALRREDVARQERRRRDRMESLQRTQSPGAPPPPSFGETSSRDSQS
ncbi:MAG: hypothetical protein ACLPVY_15440 [Acidimicrobiia bacterium]